MGVDMNIIKDYGVIANHDGLTLELKYISWAGMEAKYDLRAWKNGEPLKGMVLREEEIKKLGTIIDEYLTKQIDIKEKIKLLDDMALEKIGGKPKKASAKKTKEKAKKETKPKKEAKIIEFPKPREELAEKLVTEGNATYEECEAKIKKEMEVFVDGDSQYVLEGILELCKVDSDFRNNVMREDKNYTGAMKYMSEMARKGFAYKIGQGYCMDKDTGLMFCIDYYNSKPEVKKGDKANEKEKVGNAKDESNLEDNSGIDQKADS